MRAKRTPGRFNWMEVGYWCAYGAFTTFAIAYVMEKGAAAETMGFYGGGVYAGARFSGSSFGERFRTGCARAKRCS